MNEFSISIPGGESKRLLTGGKYCPADILVTAEGGGAVAVEEKDVNFYDYDGTLLYSYTLAEAQALTELPPAPTPKKDFLVFNRWSWYLSEIKNFGKPADIGAIYKPTDDKTYLLVETILSAEAVNIWATAGMAINWGDGSAEETFSGSGQTHLSHTFQNPGEYWIKISGSGSIGTKNATQSCVYGSARQNAVLKEAYIAGPSFVTMGAFYCCRGLEYFSQNNDYGQTPLFGNGTFQGCIKLKCLVVPGNYYPFGTSGAQDCISARIILNYSNSSFGVNSLRNTLIERVTIPKFNQEVGASQFNSAKKLKKIPPVRLISGGDYVFLDCWSLLEAEITDNTTIIPVSAFQNCFGMKKLTVGSSVATIKSGSFNSCDSMEELIFKPTTPPTVENASILAALPKTCVVKVPAASLDAYKNATNYGSIAVQMVGE